MARAMQKDQIMLNNHYDVAYMQRHLHPNDIAFWFALREVAEIAAREGHVDLRELRPCSIGNAERRDCPQRFAGWCRRQEGIIALTLRYRHHETGEWMPGARHKNLVWGTLAHELAHFDKDAHGPAHDEFTRLWDTRIWDIRMRLAVERQRTVGPAASGHRVFCLPAGNL